MSEPTDRELLLEVRGDLKEVKAQVTKTNGRVTALEDWRHAQELAEAREAGHADALAATRLATPAALTIAFTKSQLAATIGGTLLVLGGGIWRLVERGF